MRGTLLREIVIGVAIITLVGLFAYAVTDFVIPRAGFDLSASNRSLILQAAVWGGAVLAAGRFLRRVRKKQDQAPRE